MKLNHVIKAQKTTKCGKCGKEIAKGDSYRWWKFRYGGRRVRCMDSACSPRPSEMINSPFLSTAASLAEGLEDAVASFESDLDVDALQGAVEEAASGFRELGEEAQGSFDNMPEGLQQGDTGQMLEGRAERCGEIADELEGLDLEGIWDEACSELPETTPDESWGDADLDKLAETLQQEREKDETKEDFAQRLAEAIDDARSEAMNDIVDEVNGVCLEVE